MRITISDFALERDVDRDTVTAYIRNHPEIKKDVSRQGKNAVIDTDSEGYSILDKQYALKVVQMVEDKESKLKLLKAQEMIIQLQNKLNDASEKIAKAESMQMLLEDKERQLNKAEEQLSNFTDQITEVKEHKAKIEVQLDQAKEKINEKDAEIQALKNELEKEKSKSWIKKLFRK